MKKALIGLILVLLIVGCIFLVFNKTHVQKPVSSGGGVTIVNNLSKTRCDINEVILNFSNTSFNDRLNRGYQVNEVLECDYNYTPVYYFMSGAADGTDTIYDAKCTLLGSSGGFAYHVTGEYQNISKNMKNCSILWSSSDDYLSAAEIIINRTNSS